MEGSHQETVHIEEGDAISRVLKRTVIHSEGDQREVSVVCIWQHHVVGPHTVLPYVRLITSRLHRNLE